MYITPAHFVDSTYKECHRRNDIFETKFTKHEHGANGGQPVCSLHFNKDFHQHSRIIIHELFARHADDFLLTQRSSINVNH